jgi:hypothetical protein
VPSQRLSYLPKKIGSETGGFGTEMPIITLSEPLVACISPLSCVMRTGVPKRIDNWPCKWSIARGICRYYWPRRTVSKMGRVYLWIYRIRDLDIKMEVMPTFLEVVYIQKSHIHTNHSSDI